MRSILAIFFIVIASAAMSQSAAYKKMLKKYYNDFPTISINDAYQHLKAKDAHFIDVRQEEEFEVGHIKGAIQVDPDSDLTNFDANKIKKDDLIIVYCSVGARSQSLGEKLEAKGYTNVKNLYGGLFHWANRQYPMVDNSNQRTTTIHGFSQDWGKWVTNGKVVY